MAIGEVDLLTRLNLSNKILIISSIILFYFIPFLINKKFFLNFVKDNFNNKKFLISSMFTITLIILFSYRADFTGGGIFFQFSNLIFKNNILFFIICFFSVLLFISLWNININNKLILLCLIASNPQLTIYHKYFDPTLIILFFLLFEYNYEIKKIINYNFLKSLYIFYFSFLILNYLK